MKILDASTRLRAMLDLLGENGRKIHFTGKLMATKRTLNDQFTYHKDNSIHPTSSKHSM